MKKPLWFDALWTFTFVFYAGMLLTIGGWLEEPFPSGNGHAWENFWPNVLFNGLAGLILLLLIWLKGRSARRIMVKYDEARWHELMHKESAQSE